MCGSYLFPQMKKDTKNECIFPKNNYMFQNKCIDSEISFDSTKFITEEFPHRSIIRCGTNLVDENQIFDY